MSSTFTAADAQPILKLRYTKKKIASIMYDDFPLLGLMPKNAELGGQLYQVPMKFATPQTRATNFAAAQASAANAGTSSKFAKFQADFFTDYATANFTGDTLARTSGDENAFVNALTTEVDGALLTLKKSIGLTLYRNGGGARGQISSGSTVASTTITLATPQDAVNFDWGMAVQVSATDGTSGAVRTGTGYIVAIDRSAGTMQVSATLGGAAANWSTVFTSCAALDYIFAYGDFGAVAQGLEAWIPASAPSSTLFNFVDRTQDSRLGGVRYTGSGAPIEETVIEALHLAAREGAKTDMLMINPLNVSQLVKSQGTKVILDTLGHSSDMPTLGFKGVKFMGPKGLIDVYPDPFCPFGVAWGLQKDTWEVISMGGVPEIIEEDGNRMLRAANADSYETRMVARYNLVCHAPGWNVRIAL